MDDDDDAELRNPFPSPPSHYSRYSSRNLQLLTLLRERAPDSSDVNQYQVLADQPDVPDWPLLQLEKPRVDWILDEPDAYYDAFGDRWFVKEKIPSLAELGGNQLYPADPSTDRRPALLGVLHSLLVTFSSLTSSLLAPPPSSASTDPPEWSRNVEWITVLSQNIMAAANDLRPVQARGNLELMMRRQLELRRSETNALHSKCDTLEAKLTDLRKSLSDISSRRTKFDSIEDNFKVHAVNDSGYVFGWYETPKTIEHAASVELPSPAQAGVLAWAEQVG